jgi:hypothetical protein
VPLNWPLIWVIVALSALPLVLNVLLRFVWAPIKVHGSQTLAAKPAYQPVDPATLTPEMREFFDSVAGRMRGLGFEVATFLGHPRSVVPGIYSAEALLVNRATDDLAVVIVTHGGSTRSLVYAFRTDFSDGSRVSTGVNPGIGVFPRSPEDVGETFAFVDDVALLYEAHRRLIARHGLADRPRRPAPRAGEEADYHQWDWQRSMRWPLVRGYHWLDERAGVYRMTWKGAFLMTWKLVPPIKPWRIALRDRRARRTWRKLGMPTAPAELSAGGAVSAEPLPQGPSAQADPRLMTLPPAAPALGYEVGLNEGEVRIERGEGHATVRAGGPTPMQVLRRQKARIGWMMLFGGLVTYNLYQWWRLNQLLRSLPPGLVLRSRSRGQWPLPSSPIQSPWFWLCAGMLLWESARLALSLRRARGLAVIVATPAGLRFTNSAGAIADGEAPRARIDSLSVVPRILGLGKRSFDLKLVLHGSSGGQLLLNGKDQQLVAEARDALAQAMGIEKAPARVDLPAGAT